MKQIRPAQWGNECLASLPLNARYLVGVSGGRDSVVLLHWLLERGYRRLIVCHFEHGLRGRSGKADARFVERMAVRLGLEFEFASADVAALARQTKQSLETAARDARLAFFSRVARRRRCPTIFLAHHADDQAETFMLNLLRGAGPRGLGAIRPVAIHQALRIVRPLLAVWRSEINAYAEFHSLKFRDDASNEHLAPRRNLLRHKIIPRLEKEFGRNVRKSIWRAATLAAAEEELIASQVPEELITRPVLPVRELRKLALALQRRTIQRWLRRCGIADVSFDDVENVRLLLSGGAPAKVNLARGRHARRRDGRIFLE